jgi:hypothetical protein
MIIIPEPIKCNEFPWVSSVYLKRGLRGEKGTENVLVVEVRPDDISETKDYRTILSDLGILCWRAANEIGPFDRVDLRVGYHA